MTAEDHALLGSLAAMASVIKDQVAALGIQVEAFEQQAKALGRKMALESRPDGKTESQPPHEQQRRTYGPQRTG